MAAEEQPLDRKDAPIGSASIPAGKVPTKDEDPDAGKDAGEGARARSKDPPSPEEGYGAARQGARKTAGKDAGAPGETGPPVPQFLFRVGLALIFLLLAAITVGVLQLRNAVRKPLPVYGTVADFTLTNQMGAPVSLADLRGHVWVADLIFTRCPGPCLKMTRQMKELQEALPSRSQTRLISLTTDPAFDTPPILTTYATRFGVDPKRWLFLTGPKADIARLAIQSLKLTAIEKEPGERQSADDLFIHSTIFVLVDKQAQLRGVFETTGDGVDPKQVRAQILDAIKGLEKES